MIIFINTMKINYGESIRNLFLERDFLLIKLISPIFFLITLFIKKDRKKICFGAWFGQKYSGSPKYIFEEASKNHNYKIIWISKSRQAIEEISKKGLNAYHAYSLRGIFHQLTSFTFICNVNSRDFSPFCMGFNSILINIGHGQALKSSFSDRHNIIQKFIKFLRDITIDKYKFYAISSEFFLEPIKKQYARNHDEIIVMPEARCDGFSVKTQELNALRSKLEISKDTLVILYMPTHRNEGEDIKAIIRNYEDLLDAIEGLKNVKLIVNLHFYDRHNADQLKEHEKVKIIKKDTDMAQYMVLSDLMIGDYSGVIFDYLYLDKRSLGYVPDYMEYKKNSRDLYFDLNTVYDYVCEDKASLKKSLHKIKAEKNLVHKSNFYSIDYQIGDFSKICFEKITKKINDL